MPPIDDPFGTPPAAATEARPTTAMIMPRPGGRAPEPAGGPAAATPHAAADGQPGAAERPRRRPQLRWSRPPARCWRCSPACATPSPIQRRPACARNCSATCASSREGTPGRRGAGRSDAGALRALHRPRRSGAQHAVGSTSDWGKQSLLITLHNEAWGGEKVFQLLEHRLQNPHQRSAPAGAVPVHQPRLRRPLPGHARRPQPTGAARAPRR